MSEMSSSLTHVTTLRSLPSSPERYYHAESETETVTEQTNSEYINPPAGSAISSQSLEAILEIIRLQQIDAARMRLALHHGHELNKAFRVTFLIFFLGNKSMTKWLRISS